MLCFKYDGAIFCTIQINFFSRRKNINLFCFRSKALFDNSLPYVTKGTGEEWAL